jgi:dTDP-6-deoxy-L-talose 4-dehydrogenase (NAD+)
MNSAAGSPRESGVVLVTGADGYIGSHVVTALSSMRKPVRATYLKAVPSDAGSPDIEWVQADIFNADRHDLFADVESVIHLAWRDGFVLNSRAHMDDLSKHVEFIRMAADEGVKQIAAMGTMHEIGYWEGPVTPETPSRPQNQYGIAKVALRDALLNEFSDQGPLIQWLRCYYIIGDDERANSVFGKVLRAAENGQTEFPFVSGKNKYDFIDINDLAVMIATISTQQEVGGVIECCTGEPKALGDVMQQFITERHLAIELKFGAYPDRPHDSPGIWGDPTRAIQAITAAKAVG